MRERIKIVVPIPKPTHRIGVHPTRRERDRRNDFVRQPKHKGKEKDGDRGCYE